jgi:hypothetical protein
MAGKSKLSNLFSNTQGDLDAGNIKPIGVGLREGEIAAIESIAAELGTYMNAKPVSKNAVMIIAIRRFLDAYLNGEITAEELSERFDRPEKPQPKLRRR